MPIIHQGYGAGDGIDFNMVASRPVILGAVEPKVCEDCGVQFFRSADSPREQRDRYCKKCRTAPKPVGVVKRAGRGNYGGAILPGSRNQ